MEYGFYGRLKEDFPSQIIVDVNEICNYACIHCPQSSFKKSDNFTGNTLSYALNKKMVDEVAQYGQGITQQIRYTANGEPLLHPQIFDILEYACKNSNTMVTLTTNGSLLSLDKINRLLEMGMGLIDFSIDAFEDSTYSKIRKNGVLSSVRDNILQMIRLKNENNYSTKIVVSFVKQKDNENEVDSFQKYWYDQGVDSVIIRKLHTAGGSLEKKKGSDMHESKPCVYLWERISLNADGKLVFCPSSWDKTRVICEDYQKQTIKEIWTGDTYRRLREAHIMNNLTEYKECMLCMDRDLTIWPDQGERGYGDMISDFTNK